MLAGYSRAAPKRSLEVAIEAIRSVEGVCAITVLRGSSADPAREPDLLVEVPHGATRTAHYRRLRARLHGDIAADLVDFFHVNTDVGAPEIAHALARLLVAAHPSRSVRIIECEIPRTFIDVNRVLDASPEAYREGGVTPGVPPWIRDPRDLALLRGLHAEYTRVASAALGATCEAGGIALFLHTYAPRSVDVEVTDDIVAQLRDAYRPEVERTWPLRPEVDVIGRGLDGTLHTDPAVLADLMAFYGEIGVDVADGRTYPLHPSTQAFHLAARHPDRTLCVEIRRDLVADPFDPFVEMAISAERVSRVAAPLARAVGRWMIRGG